MTQHDLDIANQTFPATRTDLNNALVALGTLSAGASAPSTTFAGMFWIDTSNSLLKMRNQANSAWITLGPIDNDGLFVLRNAGNPNTAKAGAFVGQLCLDTTNAVLYVCTTAGNAASAVWSSSVFNTGYPLGYQNSAAPVYATAATFTVASINCRDSTNAVNIYKSGSTTVDISTTGINGVARSTSNLTGTIAYTNGSATVTGTSTTFTTDYVAGDVIWDQTNSVIVGVVSSIGSNTSITLTANFSGTTRSGANHRRGGEVASAWYYLYAITDGTTPGLLLSTRNVAGGSTLVDLPSGYSYYRQLAFAVINNSSSDILPFEVTTGWPHKPLILYRDATMGGTPYAVLSGGTATTAFSNPGGGTNVSCSSVIPPISKIGLFAAYNVYNAGSGTFVAYMKDPDGASTGGQTIGYVNHLGQSYGYSTQFCGLNSSQQVAYRTTDANGAVYISVQGYIAEV